MVWQFDKWWQLKGEDKEVLSAPSASDTSVKSSVFLHICSLKYDQNNIVCYHARQTFLTGKHAQSLGRGILFTTTIPAN